MLVFFFFQAEDGIRDIGVTGVQTCALPISGPSDFPEAAFPPCRSSPFVISKRAFDKAGGHLSQNRYHRMTMILKTNRFVKTMMTKRYPSFTRRVSVLKCVAAIAGTTLFSPTMMAQAQFTRGIGQYPGKAADYRGPILKKRSEEHTSEL